MRIWEGKERKRLDKKPQLLVRVQHIPTAQPREAGQTYFLQTIHFRQTVTKHDSGTSVSHHTYSHFFNTSNMNI